MAHCQPIRLIVNSDDYGYYPSVSRGILELAADNKISATGILGNSPDLDHQLARLQEVPHLDVGVHLNLSHGRPLTAAMADKLAKHNGQFPSTYMMSLMILTGQVGVNDIRNEWRAQIEACRGRTIRFLNSHEHIHMLPVLFALTLELAQDYRVEHIRLTNPEWLLPIELAGLVRNTVMQCLTMINRLRFNVRTFPLLGIGQSGRLSLEYLASRFATLNPGWTYELMCHPGYFDATHITNRKLTSYHDWEGELRLLRSQEIQKLYQKYRIQLSHYE
ncbi:carbohydrate deacetylase [Methylomonas albis]|nr:ChbG/HpnK family deacetylase [Methylomonas albis]